MQGFGYAEMATPYDVPGPPIARTSLLARRTIERRPPALHDARNRAAAAAAWAGGAFAVVDGERMLEIAELAVGLAVVAQGRAARLDRFRQHLADRRRQPARGGCRPARRCASGRAARS